jgi:hypothetical protein
MKKKSIPIKTWDSAKSKLVLAGTVKYYENGLAHFYKKVSSKHYMIKKRGYGISEDVFQQLCHIGEGISLIIIESSKSIFTSKLEDWMSQPIENYGHGAQRFLSVDKMLTQVKIK